MPTSSHVPQPAEKGTDLDVGADLCRTVEDDVAEGNPLDKDSELPSPQRRAPVEKWKDVDAPMCCSHSPVAVDNDNDLPLPPRCPFPAPDVTLSEFSSATEG